MNEFKVNEIAIYQSKVGDPASGSEVMIVSVELTYSGSDMGHWCQIKNHPNTGHTSPVKGAYHIPTHCLRKKKPPKEELGTWEDIQKITEWPNKAGWSPTKTKETTKAKLPGYPYF
jgi:hypothetical protein